MGVRRMRKFMSISDALNAHIACNRRASPPRDAPEESSIERISGMARLLCNGGAVCRDRGADILKPRACRIEDDHLVI